jgi:hypothetical protein
VLQLPAPPIDAKPEVRQPRARYEAFGIR